jgi:hypothetical protein
MARTVNKLLDYLEAIVLVINDEIAGQSYVPSLCAEHRSTQPVKRLDSNQPRKLAVSPAHPLAHLIAGPIGEGEAQYALRLDPVGYRIGNALRKDKRLASAHRRHDQKTSVNMLSYPTLCVVENDFVS